MYTTIATALYQVIDIITISFYDFHILVRPDDPPTAQAFDEVLHVQRLFVVTVLFDLHVESMFDLHLRTFLRIIEIPRTDLHGRFRSFPRSRVELVKGVTGGLRQLTDQFVFVLFLLDGLDLRLANLLVREAVMWD